MTFSSAWLRNTGLICLGLAAGLGIAAATLQQPPKAPATESSTPLERSQAGSRGPSPSSSGSSGETNEVVLQSRSALDQLQIVPAAVSPVPLSAALAGKLSLNENFTAKLSAPVDGRVLEARYQPGDRITRGAMLAKVDSPDLSDTQAAARRAQVELDLKRANLVRSQELYAAGATALKEVQAAQAEAHEAQTELDRTSARLRQLNAKGITMHASGSHFTLVSPIDGVVVQRNITVGQQVHGGDNDPLYVIADPRELLLLLDLPENDVRHFSVGQLLRFTIDGASGKEYSAKVMQIAPAVDPLTRRVQVRALVVAADSNLRPEMYVRAFAVGASTQEGIEVKVAALVNRGSTTNVYVERSTGRFERVPVKVLAQHLDRAWVSAPALKSGDRVVSSGALLIDSELESASR